MIDMTQVKTVTKTGIDVSTRNEEGQFFVFGKITLLKKKDCIVAVSAGPKTGTKVRLPLTFPCTVDGVEYVADIPVAGVDAPEPAVKAKRQRAEPGQPTKIEKCRALFAANPGIDKPAMIKLFVEQAGCTPQGANTYFITCKKG